MRKRDKEFDSIYQNLALYYDNLWKNFTKQHLQRIDKILEQYKFSGKVMIDLACGTGTMVLHLAKRFSKIAGIDISPSMLSVAKSKVGKYKRKVKFIRQDMRNLSLPLKANLITCNFDSINYLLKESVVRNVFRNIYKHMNNGGLFIFDACTPHKYRNLKGVSFREFDKGYSVWIISNNPDKNLIKNRMLYFLHDSDDFFKLHKEIHIQRAYEHNKIVSWLMKSGFSLLKSIKIEGTEKSPLRILYITKKKNS